MPPTVRPATPADLPRMAAIYNQGIRDGIATFETRERTAADLAPWLGDPGHPVLVAVGAHAGDARTGGARTAVAGVGPTDPDAATYVLGWIAASSYRPRDCYAGIAEFSVYVAREARGLGVGHRLVEAFLPACEAAGLWKVLSRVFPENAGSRRLLARHDFREVGTYLRHARHHGAWRDVVIVERLLGEALADARAAGDLPEDGA